MILNRIVFSLLMIGAGMSTRAELTSVDLGTFSISLSIKDIRKSAEFYEKLGFQRVDGDLDQRWLILRNGDAKIGLFQGLFEGNGLTFNPTDVRKVQRMLKERGIQFKVEAPEGEGPASAVVVDPDGNSILLDQH